MRPERRMERTQRQIPREERDKERKRKKERERKSGETSELLLSLGKINPPKDI